MNNPNITRLVLLKTSLENDYKHTLYFTDSGSQRDYFLSRKVKDYDFTNLTYIRKDHSVKVPLIYDDVVGCNYVMYQNKSETKWYYAFIVDIKYISEGVSELILETDCIQSWLFAYTVQPSFIEREHVDRDGTGMHTYPEQVELGEYVCNSKNVADYTGESILDNSDNHMYIVVGVTKYKNNEGKWVNARGNRYTNVYSAVKYYAFEYGPDDIDDLNNFLAMYDNGYEEAIQCLFFAPYKLIDVNKEDHFVLSSNLISEDYINHYVDGNRQEETSYNRVLQLRSMKLDGYRPRNTKLYNFPYRYLNVTNNNGGSVIYHYEKFKYDYGDIQGVWVIEPTFVIKGCLTPGCSVRMTPKFYNGVEENDDESINLGKFPICNWSSDMYTNWLTQNGVNIGIDIVSGVASTVIGGIAAATPGGALVGASMIAGGVSQISSTIGQVYQHSFTPPQVKGNLNNGDIITVSAKNDFHFYEMSIKKEYAKIIDGYFDMFGYKVCEVKIPNTNHRERYWYTKTIDVNIDGAIPNKDLQVIKNAYNNGITFWRHDENIGTYPQQDEEGYVTNSNYII